jgi:hypothetical protein
MGEQLALLEQASADTEVTQLGADRGLAGECRGISSFKRVPAQPVGQRQRAHHHGGQCGDWSGLCSPTQLRDVTHRCLIAGHGLQPAHQHRQLAGEVLLRHPPPSRCPGQLPRTERGPIVAPGDLHDERLTAAAPGHA